MLQSIRLEWDGIIPGVLQDLGFGDVVRMRKPHPCGGFEWQVVRLGADIGLKCLTCGRRIMLERRALRNRLKVVVCKGEDDGQQDD